MFTLIAVIGTGSEYFHGTLSAAGLVLDELPIILLAFFGNLICISRHKWHSQRLGIILISKQFKVCVFIGGFLGCLLFPRFSNTVGIGMIFTAIPMLLYSIFKWN